MSDHFNIREDRIFLSSTFRDLKNSREKILLTFQGLDIKVEAMEHFESSAKPSIQTCLDKLEECQIYLGIIGETYGTIDEKSGKSITEIEYDRAVELYKEGKLKDIWIFKPTSKYVSEDDQKDSDKEKIKKLKNFKDKVCRDRTPRWYDDFGDLRAKISGQCLRSFVKFVEPILIKAGVQSEIKRVGISEPRDIKFVHETKSLTLTKEEKEKLDLEIHEMNKILKGLGRDPLKSHNIDVKSVTLIGNYYYGTKQYQKAIEMYDLVLREFPDDIRALNNKASSLMGEKNREEAYQLYKKASEIDPNYTDPKVNMGGLLVEMGRAKEALLILEEVYQKEEPDFALLLNLGFAHSKLGNNTKAHEFYDKAEQLAPKDIQILINIATLYQGERNFDKAIEYTDKILKIDSLHAAALVTKGSSLMEHGQIRHGIYLLEKALKIEPNRVVNLINLALGYRRLHDFYPRQRWLADLVELYAEKAFQIDNSDFMVLAHLGWVYSKCLKQNKALEFFEKSLKIKPKYVGTIMDKAVALADIGNYDEAIKCIDELEPEKNKDWQIMVVKYQILSEAKKHEEARKELDAIEKIKPLWRFFSSRFFTQIDWFGLGSE